jgi:hypothetical protein
MYLASARQDYKMQIIAGSRVDDVPKFTELKHCTRDLAALFDDDRAITSSERIDA